MVKIVCGSCQKPLSLDETKLPMSPVAVPCPVCKARITVDRRALEGGGAAAAATPPPQPEPPQHSVTDEAHDDGFGAKAIIVGTDDPTIRQSLKLVGFIPMHFPTAEAARDFYNQEFPQVVVVYPKTMTAPPLQEMSPIISLTPSDRRKSFLVLVADSLRTFDGNAAFLYGVNLVIATKDLPQFTQIYRDAHAYHERLYGAFNSVVKAMNG